MSTSPSPPQLSRSGGCFSCRQMKVKCDLVLPQCLRCQKARRKCPGYREADNFISMTERTAEKVKSSQKQTRQNPGVSSISLSKEEQPATIQESNIDFVNGNNRSGIQVPFDSRISADRFPTLETVAMDWRTQVVHGFLAVFTHDEGLVPAWLDFLPDLYNGNIQDACFTDAIHAVALMHFSQHTALGMVAVQARRFYGRALVQVSTQLNMLDQSTSDHFLASLSLLELYEMMAGEKPLLHAWETHGAAQAMLLQLRGQSQFFNRRGALMYQAINSFIRVKELAQKQSPRLIISPEPESKYSHQFVVMAVSLLSTVTAFQNHGWKLVEEAHNGAADRAELLRFLGDALAASREVDTWRQQCPQEWHPLPKLYSTSSPVASPSPTTRYAYPPKIQVFEEPTIGGLWCSLQAARIRLLQTMIECSNALQTPAIQASGAFSRKTLSSQIREAIDDISSTIPYFLGDIDSAGNLCLPSISRPAGALLVLWPLHVCALVEDLDDSYFDWILIQLYRVGNIIGCRQAIELEGYEASRHAAQTEVQSSFLV